MYFEHQFAKWWSAKLWHRVVIIVVAFIFTLTSLMFSVAQWYINKHENEPLVIGTTFIAPYAEYFELDPKQTLEAILAELGIRRLRLVSYWEEIEPTRGNYDFSGLDWQFDMAEKYDAEVSLSIGLRQPRWPECHMPQWAHGKHVYEIRNELNQFLTAVVKRYKDRPSLTSYQLENEFLLEVFGECSDFDPKRLKEELALVKSIDPDKPVIITRSNNATPSWPVREPLPDVIGAAVYKRVWDKTVTKRYFEYPLPSWYYAFLAGGAELTHGRSTILHELQIEPWLPDSFDLKTSPISEQDQTMSAAMVEPRIRYAVQTGMRTIDLWGVEWWYWRKIKHNDPSLWEEGRRTIQDVLAEENSTN
jgi:hypothetical protein